MTRVLLLLVLANALFALVGCASCEDHDCSPAPQLVADGSLGSEPSGIEHCESGRWHRASAGAVCGPGTATASCAASACECAPGASCLRVGSQCVCGPLCTRDDDCEARTICACAAGALRVIAPGFIGEGTAVVDSLVDAPTCFPADCRTDEDCDDGRCMGTWEGFHCEAAGDECQLSGDCMSLEPMVCSFDDRIGHRVCAEPINFG